MKHGTSTNKENSEIPLYIPLEELRQKAIKR